MTKTIGGIAGLALLFAMAAPGTASAASPNTMTFERPEIGKVQITETSARRRNWRRHRRHSRRHWRRRWGGPAYYYGGPYAYAPYRYRRGPSFYVSPWGFGFGF